MTNDDILPQGRVWCNHSTLGRQHFPIKTATKAAWQRSTGWTIEPAIEAPAPLETAAEPTKKSKKPIGTETI